MRNKMNDPKKLAMALLCGFAAFTAAAQDQQEQRIVVDNDDAEQIEVEEENENYRVIVRNGDVKVLQHDDKWQVSIDGEVLTFDQLLERALENNPDLRYAEADIARAVSKLRRTRMEVVREITELHRRLLEAQNRLKDQRQRGEVSGDKAQDARRELNDQVADLKSLVHELTITAGEEIGDALRDVDLHFDDFRDHDFTLPRIAGGGTRPDLSEKQIDLLSTPVSMQFEEEQIGVIVQFISEFLDEINIVVDPEVADRSVGIIRVNHVTVKDALLALTDAVPGLVFIIRDYGILATHADHAAQINAPAIPEDTPLKQQRVFMRNIRNLERVDPVDVDVDVDPVVEP